MVAVMALFCTTDLFCPAGSGNVSRSIEQCKIDNFCDKFELQCHLGCLFNPAHYADPMLQHKEAYKEKKAKEDAERREREEKERLIKKIQEDLNRKFPQA